MSKTISASYTHGVRLTLASENPVTFTSTASLKPNSGAYALYGASNLSWTITNTGVISGGSIANGIQLGANSNYVGASVVTNQSGGTIAGRYGIRIYNNAASSITNLAGASITAIQSTAASASAVYIYATSTVTNSGAITAPTSNSNDRGVFLVNGGVVSNASTGTIAGGVGILVNGISTVINAGTISAGGTTGTAVDFPDSGNNRLIVDPNAVFVGGVVGGNGILELASVSNAGTVVAGSLTMTNFTGFNAIDFDNQSKWTLAGSSSAMTGTISGFTTTDTIDVIGFFATAASYTGGNLTLTNASNAHTTLHFSGGPFSTAIPHVTTNGAGTVLTDVCFARGTLIDTPDGEVQVEKLKPGDRVVTARNGPRAVKWVGKGKVLATRGKRGPATPVIVRKGAVADNVPHQDLRVTRAHGLYIDGVLIPVEFLINHKTIVWDDRAQEVEIYHIELASHDVLLANGVPAESYRDDGNRWLFQNANKDWDGPVQDPCAAVLTGGPVVDAVWRRLLDRAGPRSLPPMTDDPDLHLIVDGERVDPVDVQGPVRVFRLLHRPETVRIVSREVVPAELGIARDPRSLGVAVRRLAVRQGTKFEVALAQDARLTDGFHAYETKDDQRWTDGCATIPIEMFTRFKGVVEVVITVAGTTQYPDNAASAARAA